MTDMFTSAISRHIWDTKYRYRNGAAVYDETPRDTWRRMARALAAVERDPAAWEPRFFEALADFKFLPGGRIQAGAGTDRRVTLFNCFVMGVLEDSMDGIFDGLKEGALTMQQGGGVGYDFSTLRPQGTRAKGVGGVASGPVSFMRIWDAMCATLLSTGARRGAMMATLRCDHPDIEAFIDAKRTAGQLRNFNLSVLVTDEFMQAVRDDADWALVFPDVQGGGETVVRGWSGRMAPVPCRVHRRIPARLLWESLMRATYGYAEPGVLFIDRINRFNNLWYREHISATNPCVTAHAWVHTAAGPRQVQELVGRPFVARVNGAEYASSDRGFFQTGRKRLYRLQTREGYALRLTADHPVLRVAEMTCWSMQTEWTKTSELRTDDRIVLHDHRLRTEWRGALDGSEGYLVGHLIGDGTFAEHQAELRAWPSATAANAGSAPDGVAAVMRYVEGIAAALPHRSDFSGWRIGAAGRYRFLRLARLTRLCEELGVSQGNKTITPAIERCSSDFYRGFLRGLFDADGSVQGSQVKGVSVRLAQSDENLLEAVQRMLLRFGIASARYRHRRQAGERWLPDGRGGRRLYTCKADHELVISGDNLPAYAEQIGFQDTVKRARLQTALKTYKRKLNRERFTAVVESVQPDGYENVYDVEIPGVNAFDANGLYVHNCGEIPLPPYGACDLGSINLVQFVREPFGANARLDIDAIRSTAAVAVRLLDNVIDASRFPLEKQAEQAQGTRRIGLGVTGLADALIMLNLHYGEAPARALAARAMQAIRDTAYRTSAELAREKGPFPFFEHEHYLAGEYIRSLPDDIREGIVRHGIRNSHLTAIAPTGTISLLANNISSGIEPVYDFHYRRRVLELDGGTCEYELTDYALERWRALRGDVPPPPQFTGAHEIAPAAHLDMQAAIQPYVDNSISKTINVPTDYAFADFKGIYEEAFNRGLKGCTTFRPNPITGAVLEASPDQAPLCCTAEREAD